MLQTGSTFDPLLKRPFSIFYCSDKEISFLYRIRGKGTLSLSTLKRGDVINVIGPLGNGYLQPEDDFIAVAGGIGIASLYSLLKNNPKKAYLFYGARNRDELVMLDELKSLSKEMFITTDDGSEGKRGLITDVLKLFLKNESKRRILSIYACGPNPMLKELHRIIKGVDVKCYVSLEEYMACGIGACIGCVIKVRTDVEGQKWTYKRVCKEGPVFDIRDIVWE